MVPPNGPSLRALDVDVDPLVVAGGVGELVDPVLVDLSQSVVPSSSPTAAASSSMLVKTRIVLEAPRRRPVDCDGAMTAAVG